MIKALRQGFNIEMLRKGKQDCASVATRYHTHSSQAQAQAHVKRHMESTTSVHSPRHKHTQHTEEQQEHEHEQHEFTSSTSPAQHDQPCPP